MSFNNSIDFNQALQYLLNDSNYDSITRVLSTNKPAEQSLQGNGEVLSTTNDDQSQERERTEDGGLDKELFIIELRKYPSLWNKRCPTYKNRNIKVNAWKMLAQTFNKDGKCNKYIKSGIACSSSSKKKQKKVRCCFVSYLRSLDK